MSIKQNGPANVYNFNTLKYILQALHKRYGYMCVHDNIFNTISTIR